MRVGIELSGNKCSKIFISLSFGACNSAEIGFLPLDFVDPEIYLRSRGYTVPIMVFQTENDFDCESALIREEFDNIAVFSFHPLDTFCPMQGLLPA
jgi:hypothetical protein